MPAPNAAQAWGEDRSTEAEFPTNHVGSVDIPRVVTNCAPTSIAQYLNSASMLYFWAGQADCLWHSYYNIQSK